MYIFHTGYSIADSAFVHNTALATVASGCFNIECVSMSLFARIRLFLRFDFGCWILGFDEMGPACRWDFGPPRILRNSLDIIGRITLGVTMYNIGDSLQHVFHLGFVQYYFKGLFKVTAAQSNKRYNSKFEPASWKTSGQITGVKLFIAIRTS